MRTRPVLGLVLVSTLAVLTVPALTGAANAAVLNVDCGSGGDLQNAINSASSGDTINITGTCTGNFTINSKTLTLAGTNGDATLDGGGTGATLSISGPATQVVTLDLLVVTGGIAGTGGGINASGGSLVLTRDLIQGNSAQLGGGILFAGGGASENLSITDTTVRDNTATSAAFAEGGGIDFHQFGGGTLTMNRSTVSGNTSTGAQESNASGFGGGIEIVQGGATITNSTISGNTAFGAGSGSGRGGGIEFAFAGSVSIVASTITDNHAAGSVGVGGGLFLEEGERPAGSGGLAPPATGRAAGDAGDPTLTNTILAGNSASFAGPDCSQNGEFNPYSSGGYDLVGDSSACGFNSVATDQVGSGASPIDPKIGPLANNGGWGKTHRLSASSPALDAIPPASCMVTTDERGNHRPRNHACDIGAFEASESLNRTMCTIKGTASDDPLTGTVRDDTICGFAGADTITGLGGDDLLFGWSGNDSVDGGPGNDTIYGLKGDDSLVGGAGQDRIKGGYGKDTINSQDGEAGDTVDGGKGADVCTTDAGDTVTNC